MAASEGRQVRVLVVEDEFLISAMLCDELLDRGYDVYVCSNAADALQRLADGHACDVLLTDINLPGGFDGEELASRARALRPGLPVVYSSGAVTRLEQIRAVAGAAFIPKPYDFAKVGKILSQMTAAALMSA
jgi:CheY-like chemotaxis protein